MVLSFWGYLKRKVSSLIGKLRKLFGIESSSSIQKSKRLSIQIRYLVGIWMEEQGCWREDFVSSQRQSSTFLIWRRTWRPCCLMSMALLLFGGALVSSAWHEMRRCLLGRNESERGRWEGRKNAAPGGCFPASPPMRDWIDPLWWSFLKRYL